MNAKELRLGNLVVYNGSVFKVTGISGNKITADRGKGNVEFDPGDLQPLKITEFWLEKFKIDYSFPGVKWIMEEMPIPTGINYVHQFQNIYFFLTFTELQLKESEIIKFSG
ncbi:hypothetical protein [Chryseobacterium gambrini]|uniref:hypothetical protein n=1 Tax=Chryseobacterium gambrini TaxID=373672 RepID=UPI003D0A4135